MVRCRLPHRVPKQSTNFIDSPEHACVNEHSFPYKLDTASHLCYRVMLKVIVNAHLYFGSSGFPSTRINLSPFTKDFRGGEQLNESVD